MGFDLLKLNMFRGGIFKQAKYLVSTPQRAQKVVFISETGTISQELLPMFTGFISADVSKKAWIVLHSLKFSLKKKNQPAQDEQVLLISERSYIPLDPNGRIKPKDKEKLVSLTDISRLRHAGVIADMGKGGESPTDIAQLIITGSFVLWALMVVAHLVRIKLGG